MTQFFPHIYQRHRVFYFPCYLLDAKAQEIIEKEL